MLALHFLPNVRLNEKLDLYEFELSNGFSNWKKWFLALCRLGKRGN